MFWEDASRSKHNKIGFRRNWFHIYVDEFGDVSCMEVVEDGGLVQVGQVGHVLAFFKLPRVDLEITLSLVENVTLSTSKCVLKFHNILRPLLSIVNWPPLEIIFNLYDFHLNWTSLKKVRSNSLTLLLIIIVQIIPKSSKFNLQSTDSLQNRKLAYAAILNDERSICVKDEYKFFIQNVFDLLKNKAEVRRLNLVNNEIKITFIPVELDPSWGPSFPPCQDQTQGWSSRWPCRPRLSRWPPQWSHLPWVEPSMTSLDRTAVTKTFMALNEQWYLLLSSFSSSTYLSIALSITLYITLYITLSITLYITLSITLSIILSITLSLSIYLSIYHSFYLSLYLSLSIYLSIYHSFYLLLYLSTYPYITFSTCLPIHLSINTLLLQTQELVSNYLRCLQ